MRINRVSILVAAAWLCGGSLLGAQAPSQDPLSSRPAPGTPPPAASAPAAAAAGGATVLSDYVIGPDDVLTVVFWRDKDLSGDVVVRPDGKISLPLLNDVRAAGLTTDELRLTLVESAGRYIADPNVTVIVKQINSRRVFITGQVAKPGPYQLTSATTVVQLIALAGGLTEFADSKNIVVIRPAQPRERSFRVNYRDVTKRKNLRQNIELLPGDTVIVP
jgi:polysaccharide export outer membrane protein